jgi:hypothetical protein
MKKRTQIRNGYKRAKMVEILCTHVRKWKNEACWNYFRNDGKRDKRG